MKLFDFEVRTGPGWLLTFAAYVYFAIRTNATFDTAWVAFLALFSALTGRRLWKELKGPNVTITTPEDPQK
jgi:hypothetical protein